MERTNQLGLDGVAHQVAVVSGIGPDQVEQDAADRQGQGVEDDRNLGLAVADQLGCRKREERDNQQEQDV